MSPQPKRHLDRFSRFCRAQIHDQQTHTQTGETNIIFRLAMQCYYLSCHYKLLLMFMHIRLICATIKFTYLLTCLLAYLLTYLLTYLLNNAKCN